MRFLLFALLLALSSFMVTVNAEFDHLTQNQWVQPTQSGKLVGRLVLPAEGGSATAVEGAEVAIMSRDGEVLRSDAKTNSKGQFVINNVEPGVYAFTARAKDIFACCAIHVIDSELQLDHEYPSEAEISAANIDYTTVNTAIIRYLPPSVKRTEFGIETAELNELAARVCGKEVLRVEQFGSGLKGRLHGPGARGSNLQNVGLTNVFIMKKGLEYGRAVTNNDGEFVIENLPAGQYSLMAIGLDGLGLIGFELVSTSNSVGQSQSNDRIQLVGHELPGCCPEFSMQLAPIPEVITICEQPVETCGCGQPVDQCGCGVPVDQCGCEFVDGVGTPIAGGYAVGGGYGGGYGGGFGGGEIAGLAGIGGLAIALSSDDIGGVDGGVDPPPAASRVNP